MAKTETKLNELRINQLSKERFQQALNNGEIVLDEFYMIPEEELDVSQTPVEFTQASTRSNISSGETVSTIFGKIAKWFSDLGSLAFKSTVAKTDLESSVQTSLGKADNAVPNTRTVNNKALSSNITLTASDVSARPNTWTPSKSDIGLGNVGNFKAVSTVANQGLTDTEKSNARANIGAGTSTAPNDAQKNVQSDWNATSGDAFIKNKPTIPTTLSSLSGDSTHRVVTDAEKATWNAKSNFSGSYNDLTDKPVIPTIPTDVSAFNNDAGYLTEHQSLNGYAKDSDLSSVAKTGSYNDLIDLPEDSADIWIGTLVEYNALKDNDQLEDGKIYYVVDGDDAYYPDEKVSNKTDVIDGNNSTSTMRYPSNKAVVDYVGGNYLSLTGGTLSNSLNIEKSNGYSSLWLRNPLSGRHMVMETEGNNSHVRIYNNLDSNNRVMLDLLSENDNINELLRLYCIKNGDVKSYNVFGQHNFVINATTANDDMDVYFKQGTHFKWYRTGIDTLNTPAKAGITGGYNYAVIMSYTISANAGKQVAFQSGTPKVYVRYMNDGVITAWAELAPSAHNHSASEITSGTLAVARGGTGQTTLDLAVGTAGARAIYAGTTAMTAGTTSLTTGRVYFQYE